MALRQEEFASLCDDVDLDRDRALVERCQAGDSAAFGNLYARYYERLLRFCLRRLNDRHEAEDAAQEAFARAWKALPNFAGERRFYPWLTVIAGNICTDMLRRRSRSTPTDDVELGSHQPMGVSTADTSEELVLAAVDGELVTRALGRLSSRHQHVLAMREGSGWTYQQIADHEGVEIGTIETLLWRARQALKREFTVLSESKGALAGFLAGAGALLKRTVFRVAHRTSVMQANGSGAGSGLRNAVIGGAVTSAAVAAALITPHALSSGPSHNAPQVALPNGTLTMPAPLAIAPSAPAATSGLAESATSFAGAAIDGSPAVAPGGTSGGLLSGTAMHNGGLSGAVSGSGSGGGLSATTQNPGSTAGGVVGGVGGGLQGLTGGLLGSGSPLGSVTAPIAGVTTPVLNDVGTLTNTIATTLDNLAPTLGLGQVLSGLNGVISGTTSGSSGSTSPTTTTPTTNPVSGLVNGVAGTVNKTLGGVTKLLGGK